MNIFELVGLPRLAFEPDTSRRWQDLFGLELELENVSSFRSMSSWTTHNDQSLRSGGVEFVTAAPMGGSSLMEALREFYSSGITYTSGPRTSTHIHLNMLDSTVTHMRSLLCVVYAIEDSLFNVIGESRKWSGYAMPLSEMDPARLRSILSDDDTRVLLSNLAPSRNAERYYGCNTAALRRFGTLEFRYFPGGPSRAELESWLDLLESLKYGTRRLTVDEMLAVESPDAFIRLLTSIVGREWATRLVEASSAADMFDKFTEVVAMAESSGDALERRERLVFVSPALISFVTKRLIESKERGDRFRDEVSKLKILSQNDFVWYVRRAVVDEAVSAAQESNSFSGPIRRAVPSPFAQVFAENPFDAPSAYADDDDE